MIKKTFDVNSEKFDDIKTQLKTEFPPYFSYMNENPDILIFTNSFLFSLTYVVFLRLFLKENKHAGISKAKFTFHPETAEIVVKSYFTFSFYYLAIFLIISNSIRIYTSKAMHYQDILYMNIFFILFFLIMTIVEYRKFIGNVDNIIIYRCKL